MWCTSATTGSKKKSSIENQRCYWRTSNRTASTSGIRKQCCIHGNQTTFIDKHRWEQADCKHKSIVEKCSIDSRNDFKESSPTFERDQKVSLVLKQEIQFFSFIILTKIILFVSPKVVEESRIIFKWTLHFWESRRLSHSCTMSGGDRSGAELKWLSFLVTSSSSSFSVCFKVQVFYLKF